MIAPVRYHEPVDLGVCDALARKTMWPWPLNQRSDMVAFRELAHSTCFSSESSEWVLQEGFCRAARDVCALIEHERRRRERLFRKAASFPAQVVRQLRLLASELHGGLREGWLDVSELHEAHPGLRVPWPGRVQQDLSCNRHGLCRREREQDSEALRHGGARPTLLKASRDEVLDRCLADMEKSDLAILDEFGCIPIDTKGTRLLPWVISSCYERRSPLPRHQH